MSKDVVTKEENLPVSTELFEEFEKVSGTGFENITAGDLAIPFYGILQALSPQVKKGPQRIDGAEEGSIYNTVTQSVTPGDQGITVIPCGYMKRWVEWVPRDAGGGFVGQHERQPEGVKQVTTAEGRIKNVLPNGHEIIETAYFFILRILPTGGVERAIIAMSSTQHKAAKKWVKMQMDFVIQSNGKTINLPGYAQIYTLTTKMESKGNNSWAGWDICAASAIKDKALFDEAKAFHKFILEERPTFAPPSQESEEAPTTDHF